MQSIDTRLRSDANYIIVTGNDGLLSENDDCRVECEVCCREIDPGKKGPSIARTLATIHAKEHCGIIIRDAILVWRDEYGDGAAGEISRTLCAVYDLYPCLTCGAEGQVGVTCDVCGGNPRKRAMQTCKCSGCRACPGEYDARNCDRPSIVYVSDGRTNPIAVCGSCADRAISWHWNVRGIVNRGEAR